MKYLLALLTRFRYLFLRVTQNIEYPAPLTDEKWFDIYRKIQDKKKNLVLQGGINDRNLAAAERLIKSIDPVGVYISVHCSSPEKAEDLLEKVTRWSE